LIHAASPASPTQYDNPREIEEANQGFLKRLEVVGFPAVSLLISSGEVYGAKPPSPVPETYEAEIQASGIRAAYPDAKLAAEKLILDSGKAGKTIPKIVRLFHTFGPGLKLNDGRSFSDFIWAGARGQSLILRSSGDAVRSFLYIEDAIAGILHVLLQGAGGGVYNLGSPKQLSILEYAELVALEAGVSVTKPKNQSEVDGYIASPIHFLVPDTRKIMKLGWSNQVSPREGIRRTLKWAKYTLDSQPNETHR
jgi:nucleoside-diphosphate-sugar epimerase